MLFRSPEAQTILIGWDSVSEASLYWNHARIRFGLLYTWNWLDQHATFCPTREAALALCAERRAAGGVSWDPLGEDA